MAAAENFGLNGPELLLGQEDRRPYGLRQTGMVLDGDTKTPITLRMPIDGADSVYVFANGWTGDKNSMRRAAIEATQAGHNAVTFSYTNTGTSEALEENAKEMTAVIDALPEGWERRVMGLSMGGWVTAKALKRINTQVQAATLIASAGFMLRNPSRLEVVQHLSAEGLELVANSWKDPINTAKLGYSSARHTIRRLRAIGAEIGELTHGSAHDIIHAVKAAHSAPFMRFAYGDADKLIPPRIQEEGIADMPFDEIWKYPGDHVAVVFNPLISRRLFELDAQLPSWDPVPIAA